MIISVNGFEEAKAYPVLFGSTELLMDNTRDVFYVKAVDNMGKYSMSTYEFKQIENEKPLSAADVVTREQFDALSQKLDALLSSLTQPAPPAQPAPQPEPQPQPKPKSKSDLII